MDERIRSAARSAERSSPFRLLARGGYVANGLIHVLIGSLVIAALVQGGRARADQAGALEAIASVPLGLAVLWAIVVLLGALGAFHGVHGFALRRESRRERWGRRLSEWGQACAFIVMGGIAAVIAVGARPDPDESAQEASRGLLGLPGGWALLGLAGAGVGVAGIVWIVMGVRRSFRKQLRLPQGRAGRLISALGAVGFVSKGIALLAVGGLLISATVQRDPEAAGALDAAVGSLRGLPFGEAVMLVIGAGFIVYGVFCFFRARLATL